MSAIQFTLLVEPKSVQHGSRAGIRRGKIRFYNDREKTAYQTRIILEAKHHAPKEPLEGPLLLHLHFWIAKPKGSEKSFADGKPDLDNLCKGVTDALSHCGLWKNDSQIVWLDARKDYNEHPSLPPRIEVRIN